jgi:hypothetical protein
MPTAKDELYGDQQQRKFQKPKTKTILESDSGSVGTPKKVQQKNSLKEIWEDPEQREYSAPETKELYTDVQQREYTAPETTQIPGYTQTRTSFIGKMNKSKSLRNNL